MAVTAPTTDATMTLVPSWLDTVFPQLDAFFVPALGNHGKVSYNAFELTPGGRAAAAYRCALAIAGRRLASNPIRFFSWLAHLSWAEPLDASVAAHLRVPLLVNLGTRSTPSSEDHLLGLLAETLWYELTSSTATVYGRPVLLEGHDWSVTDPGGDGLAVYRDNTGLRFTLWESKSHRSDAGVRSTVNGACRQLRSNAPDYLGRFSIVAQRVAPDAQLASFLCLMAEYWADKSPEANVGISIATSVGSNHVDCFKSMPRYFGLDVASHSGAIFRINHYRQFASAVRDLIWRGAGL